MTIDTTNKFAVAIGAGRDGAVHIMRSIPRSLSKAEALNLAAYLVALADDDGDFAELLEAVMNA